jgi:hypothetical protein
MAVTRKTERAVVVASGTGIDVNQLGTQIALYNSDGTVASTVKKQAAQADSTATDVPGLKTDFNALLAKLRSAGILS